LLKGWWKMSNAMRAGVSESIGEAVRILRAGGLVAFPTETVYGLGADASNSAAVRKIFAVKSRSATNPLIVHVADAAVARRYAATWPDAASKLAARFWPGPLTLVLPKQPLIVDEVTAGKPTVGLRVPDHRLTLELLKAFDGPLAGPSANRSTRVSPTTADHVRQELGDGVDLVLDGGPCTVGIESTVLDLSGTSPIILRPGGVLRDQIEREIGPVGMFSGHVSTGLPATSPGQHEIHYSPVVPAFWYLSDANYPVQQFIDARQSVVVLCITSSLHGVRRIQMPNTSPEYARRLYAALREADQAEISAILIELPPDQPAWAAVRDRLLRASRPFSEQENKI
jgi:L-threonylcarbamoyladenylate synthase